MSQDFRVLLKVRPWRSCFRRLSMRLQFPGRHNLYHPFCTLQKTQLVKVNLVVSLISYVRKLDEFHRTASHKWSSKERCLIIYLDPSTPASIASRPSPAVLGTIRTLIGLSSIAIWLGCKHCCVLDTKKIIEVCVGACGAQLMWVWGSLF